MYTVVLITAKDYEEARKISDALLQEKLIACANIVQGVKSLFWWEGKIDNADEALVVIKTKRNCLKEIIQRVKKLHSYSNPEVIALPIIEGNKDYLKWMDESVKK